MLVCYANIIVTHKYASIYFSYLLLHITLLVQCQIIMFVLFVSKSSFRAAFLFSRKIIGLIINQLQNNCKKYLHRIGNLFYICTHKTTTKHYVHNRHNYLRKLSINWITANYYGYRLHSLPKY